MRFLYSFFITLSMPLVILYFLFRGLRDRSYLSRLPERFGSLPFKPEPGGILIHAASVGEFNAAGPLIKALLKRYPELPLTVTTLTPTGSVRVKKELGDKVSHCYLPFDLPWTIPNFLAQLQPSVVVVVETEIWPNLFLNANRMDIPLIMVNARLSERSLKRFSSSGHFIRKVLRSVNWFGAQSGQDAKRLEQCGADRERIEMTGNLKFDLQVAASLEESAEARRVRWNPDRPVLVAGSTHEADENVILPAFAELLEDVPNALLILVPRYPERFERAAQLAKATGLTTTLHSQAEICDEQTQCFVIDTIGELMTYYACADLAYVGGSIGDQGGHNPLEPAALGKPVLFGPNMVNAREIANQLLSCSAAEEISNSKVLCSTAKRLLNDGSLRDEMGLAGKKLIERNKGALKSSLAAVQKYTNQPVG